MSQKDEETENLPPNIELMMSEKSNDQLIVEPQLTTAEPEPNKGSLKTFYLLTSIL